MGVVAARFAFLWIPACAGMTGLVGKDRFWVALLVVWGAPPFCPPRLPSPWPSPAERERGNVRLRRSVRQGLLCSGFLVSRG